MDFTGLVQRLRDLPPDLQAPKEGVAEELQEEMRAMYEQVMFQQTEADQ